MKREPQDPAAWKQMLRPNTLEGQRAAARSAKAAGPQTLGQALSQLIALRGLARTRGDSQLVEIWNDVAGVVDPAIAAQTKVMGINRGCLQIAVPSAALLSELASFHKAALLARLREKHGHLKVRDLKFRLKGDLQR